MFKAGASSRRCVYCKGANENKSRQFFKASDPKILAFFRKQNESYDENTLFCPKCFNRGKNSYRVYQNKLLLKMSTMSQSDSISSLSQNSFIFASQTAITSEENTPNNSQEQSATNSKRLILNDKSSESMDLHQNSFQLSQASSSETLDIPNNLGKRNIDTTNIVPAKIQKIAAIESKKPHKLGPKSVLEKRKRRKDQSTENDTDESENNIPLINLRRQTVEVDNNNSDDISINNTPVSQFPPSLRRVGFKSVQREISSSEEDIDVDDLVPLNLRQKKSQIPRQRTVQPPTKAPPPPSLSQPKQPIHLPVNDYVRSLAG